MSLEDFHTKALRLVTQAGYEGDAKNKVLRDNIISGLASDKIRAKIVKEGHEVTLNRVMEIARLEVSTQQHLERMQETAKVNYIQYGKSTKSKKGKKPQSGAGPGQGVGGHRGSRPSGKFNKRPPLPPDTCYRCGKGRHQKAQDCKVVDATCRGCGKKGHYEKVCLKGKCSAHSLETPQANSAGASEPLYFNDEGQPIYTYMVSVPHANVNKHLIKFPVALEPTTLKGNNMDSQSTVLLKADTGADVNLMNRKTFNQLFGGAKVLKPTPIKMENYGNTAVKVLGMFHAFLRWKDKVYRQLFYMTDCDRSPNLLSRDACFILGVLKPCYTVEKTTSKNTPSPTVNASTKGDVAAKSFHHQKMNGSEEKLSNNSNKQSINQSQLQGDPLTKQDILDIYSDVFTRIGKFPGMPYKFQLKENAKPMRHAPRKVPIHLQDAFHKEIRNLEKLGILEETKDVTEWVNSFVIVEKIPTDSNSSQGHSKDSKLRICLDPRDLNEALEREPYYTWSIEEIMAKFHGMTRFTIADFNKGYWMVELDPESRKYTMMALDIGRFQWTRLPMGSIVAQDVFQRKLDGIFLDIPGVTGIADDMVIYGRSNLEHGQTSDQLSGHLQKEYIDIESRQNAVQTSKNLILWTPVECQGTQCRSKEDCSGQKDESTHRC